MSPMSPKITLEKEKKKLETARRKKEGEEKNNGCTPSFYIEQTEFETKKLFDGTDLFWL